MILPLFDTIVNPIEPHVNGLRMLLFGGVIGKPSFGSGVVGFHGNWCC